MASKKDAPFAVSQRPGVRISMRRRRARPGRSVWPGSDSHTSGILGTTLLLLLGLVAGCASPSGRAVGFWIADDIHPPPGLGFRSDEPDLYDPVLRRLTLAGAINETLGFHLALSAGDQPLSDLDVTADAFRYGEAAIPASAVKVFRLHDIRIERWPGWHIRSIEPSRRMAIVPDVLVPADAPKGGLPVTLGRNESLPLWVDVSIPKGTPPGAYTGRLTVRSRGRVVESIELSLTVWPFLLPDAPDLALLAEIDHRALAAQHIRYQDRPYHPERVLAGSPRQKELEALITATFRLLQEHKLSPVLTSLHPVAKITPSQDVQVDWDDYDRVVRGLIDGTEFADRRPLPAWPVPFDESFPPPPRSGAVGSPTYSRTACQYLRRCAEHFRDRGWLDRAYVSLPHAERPQPTAFDAVRHFAGIARDADPALRTLCRLFPQDMSAYGWPDFQHADLSREVDIWCPAAQFFDPTATSPFESAEMWYRVDRPPFSGSTAIQAASIATRVIPWQAFRLGVSTVLLGPVHDLCLDGDELAPQQCIDRQPSALVYPGSPFGLSEPVPSMRLKRLRRGMQDVAYLKLLRTRDLPHVADALAESLVRFAGAQAYGAHFADGRSGGWVEDPHWWRVVRRVMTDELLRNVEKTSGDTTQALASSIQWRRFMEATRTIDISVDGVHLRATPDRDNPGGTYIEVTLTIRNRTRVPVSGAIGFGELPIGWRAEPAAVNVPEIAPGQARRTTLTARAAAVTWNDDGIRYLPIVFDTHNRGTLFLAARLAYLPARWLEAPPNINGDLSDWPAGYTSVASDFVLITGEPPADTGTRTARPAETTRCFVARDRDALYFGFHCSGEGLAQPDSWSNALRYDDLVPLGEELVEVLIDPDLAGTRSPGDLYHLVVKLSGATWERGIETYPPAGPRRLWPADIRHAVRCYDDHWEAEVRVPLEAFNRPIRQHQIWGVNFTRFDAARQEYANWAGAAGNAYDPMSLGNLGL